MQANLDPKHACLLQSLFFTFLLYMLLCTRCQIVLLSRNTNWLLTAVELPQSRFMWIQAQPLFETWPLCIISHTSFICWFLLNSQLLIPHHTSCTDFPVLTTVFEVCFSVPFSPQWFPRVLQNLHKLRQQITPQFVHLITVGLQ